jgi:CubicO group peptidase (beta-lactamase class C family)
LSINSIPRSILLTALLVVLIFHTASAQESQTGPTNPQELEVFMDGLLLSQLDSFRIAGAVVSVVKDGEIFFSKGYGYSDVETKQGSFRTEHFLDLDQLLRWLFGQRLCSLSSKDRST